MGGHTDMEIKVPLIKEGVGLGDVVKAVTTAVGIKPCGGCGKRAIRLNSAVQFIPRTRGESWGESAPAGWDLQASKGCVSMYSKQGRWIVWEMDKGKFRIPHSFCCGLAAEEKAREKMEVLCR